MEYLWSIGDVGDSFEVLCVNAKKKNRMDGDVNMILALPLGPWSPVSPLFDSSRAT